MEHEEYTAETYPSFGKKYNGEKAVISLTSWKARINTVSKTLFSLIQQCPGFHIVLVLSEEEFPKMCEELPENLMLFVENEMIELLWVYKNYKSLKKWIFTAFKYNGIPIITADDDCFYVSNYAEKLYKKFEKTKKDIITYNNTRNGKYKTIAEGQCTLFANKDLRLPFKCFQNASKIKSYKWQDDVMYNDYIKNLKQSYTYVRNDFVFPYYFHTQEGAINKGQSNSYIKHEEYIK